MSAPLRTSKGQGCIAGKSRTKHSSIIVPLNRTISGSPSISMAVTPSFSAIVKAVVMSAPDATGSGKNSETEHVCSRLHFFASSLCYWIVTYPQKSHFTYAGYKLAQQLKSFCSQRGRGHSEASYVAARVRHAVAQPKSDWITNHHHHNRNLTCRVRQNHSHR